LIDTLQKLYKTNNLTKDELVQVLEKTDQKEKQVLFEYAHQTRLAIYGTRVYMRGLIEFSNYCRQNCKYCGIRASNENASRYRLTEEEIVACCQEGYELGYRTFVLQSGEDYTYTASVLESMIRRIKTLLPDAAVTLSIGERDIKVYKKLYEAGADRFLLRHETASRGLYEQLHPGMSYDNRMVCLNNLKDIGYQVGAGFMVGLPGQTAVDLAEDLLFLKEFHPHMIGIGPFIPHSETPLKSEKGGTVEDTLLMVALARLLVPDALIPATTAMGTLHPQGRELALKAGANVVMPNLTPVRYRDKYELYENKICLSDEPAHCRGCIERRILSVGLETDMGRGDHPGFKM